jgi:hypothetical protein
MKQPLHLNSRPTLSDADALLERIYHFQAMVTLTRGRGFRMSPKHAPVGEMYLEQLMLETGMLSPRDEDYRSKRCIRRQEQRAIFLARLHERRAAGPDLSNRQRAGVNEETRGESPRDRRRREARRAAACTV